MKKFLSFESLNDSGVKNVGKKSPFKKHSTVKSITKERKSLHVFDKRKNRY
jgi:hypothetical protein